MQARVPFENLLSELRRNPQGLTVNQMAINLDMPSNGLGSRLSKMYNYGLCDRQFLRRTPPNYGGDYLVYFPKPLPAGSLVIQGGQK